MPRSVKSVKAAWMAKYAKKPSLKKRQSKRHSRIKGSIKPREELKFVDTVITATASSANYTAAGVVTLLNGIAQGDDYSARDGRQATMKSVALKTTVYYIANGTTPGAARTMLVWDNAANGALAAVTDILASASAASFPNINNAQRFTILRDYVVELGGLSITATQTYSQAPAVQKVDLYVPLDDVTQFLGTGATIASIQNGALLLLTIGDNQAAQNSQMVARVRFADD